MRPPGGPHGGTSKGLLSIRLPVCDVTRANLKQWAMPPIRPPSMEAHTHTVLQQFRVAVCVNFTQWRRPALCEKEGRSIPTSRSQSVCASVLGVVDTNAARQMPQWLAKTLFALRLMHSLSLFFSLF